MASHQKHKQPRAKKSGTGLRGSLFMGLLFTIGAVAVWVYINKENLREYEEAYKKRQAEIELINELNQNIDRIRKKQRSLLGNGSESEREVRERLDWQKRGEVVYYLVNEEDAGTTTIMVRPNVEGSPESENTAPATEPTPRTPALPGTSRRESQGEIRSLYDLQ